MPRTKIRDKKITQIAKDILNIETLEERHGDWLDFHEVSVWSLKVALNDAYEAGKKAGKKSRQK